MSNTTESVRLDTMAALLARHLKSEAVRTAQDAFSMGTLLWAIKEAAAKGKWRGYVNQVGISAQEAERLIACARRFRNASVSFLESIGSASHLFELLALSSDDIQALMHGLEVHGLTLDRVGTLTKVQLRDAVRRVCELDGKPLTQPKRRPVLLKVDEEHMLRLFRQCTQEGRAALLSVAGPLAESARVQEQR